MEREAFRSEETRKQRSLSFLLLLTFTTRKGRKSRYAGSDSSSVGPELQMEPTPQQQPRIITLSYKKINYVLKPRSLKWKCDILYKA